MADTKLTDLTLGTHCDLYYGEQGGASHRYNGTGFYNVKDYGAFGDGSHNDTSNIQTAIDAALGSSYPGGTIFFPPGNYKTVSALTLPGNMNKGLRFLGSGIGPYAQYAQGSVIKGDVNDYLLKVTHDLPPTGNPDGTAISGIVNLGFCNTHTGGTVTSTDVTPGCVYMAGGIGTEIHGCSFQMPGDGILLFSGVQGTRVTGGLFSGGFSGSSGAHSLGVWLYNGYIGDCKLYTLGTAIIAGSASGAFLAADNLNIEVCGCGFLIGKAPVDFIDTNDMSLIHSSASTCSLMAGSIRDTGMESIGDNDGSTPGANVYVANASELTIENARWVGYNQIGHADYGLYAEGAKSCDFRNLDIEGYFDVAAVAVGGTGNTFHTIYAAVNPATAGTPLWTRALQSKFAGDDGNTFELCNIASAADVALPMDSTGSGTYFPLAPRGTGQTVLCSDSPAVPWIAGSPPTNNIGMPITAAATASSATAAAGTTLHFAAVPPWIANSWKVFNLTNPNTSLAPNTLVQSTTGTSVTILTAFNTGGVATNDVIGFVSPGGTNTALLRWTGTAAGNDGAWRIAG